MVKTDVKIGGLHLKNPVMTASGTFGYGLEFADFVDLEKLGGFVVKGTTLKAREGNPYPRSAETPMGMLNAVGLQNKGVDYFAEHIYPELKDLKTNVIVNVSGACIEDYVATAEKVAALDGIPGIELNISCPNVKQGGMAFGVQAASAAEVVSAVRKVYPKTLIVKLSPNVTDITEIARAVEGAGADSVSLINTLLGMAIDSEKRRPILSTVTGGMSGPAVKQGGMAFGVQAASAAEVVSAVRKVYPKTLIVKLSPNVTDITEIARAVEGAGADSVSLINTLLGMAIDSEKRRPILSTITGGMSGPAVKPIALRMVWQVSNAVKIPVVGMGGITNGKDAIEFLLAGASAIEVGTANFMNPAVTGEIVDYIEDYLVRHNFSSVDEIIGGLQL